MHHPKKKHAAMPRAFSLAAPRAARLGSRGETRYNPFAPMPPASMPSMTPLTQTRAWALLSAHRPAIAGASLPQMFAADPQRFENFSLRMDGILLDYSKNLVNAETMQLLVALARERGVGDEITAPLQRRQGQHERKPAGAAYGIARQPRARAWTARDVLPQIQATLARMREFTDGVRAGTIAGRGGEKFTDVIHIGIGGSHLGPALASRALAPYARGGPRVHYRVECRRRGGCTRRSRRSIPQPRSPSSRRRHSPPSKR